MYQIETASHRVEKEISTLPRRARERVIQGARKLSGEMRGAWRIRVGDYRVIYDIDDDQRMVTILAVLHRREAYR
jgi:mRNA interferase RelE/StbE